MMKEMSRKKGIQICIVSILLCLLVLQGEAFAGEEEELYLQASELKIQQRWSNAIETFSRLVTKYPGTRFFDAYFWIGYCQKENGNYREAISTFKSFASKYPNTKYATQALYKVGEIYEKNLHEYDKAIAAYNEVDRVYPRSQESIQSKYRKGELESALGNFTEAKETYQKVVELTKDNKNIYPGYQTQSQIKSDFIEVNSDLGYRPLALFKESEAYEHQGFYDRAIESYGNLIRKYPNSNLVDDSHFKIILCWEKKGNMGKVREEGRSFLRNYSKSEYAPQVEAILKRYGQ